MERYVTSISSGGNNTCFCLSPAKVDTIYVHMCSGNPIIVTLFSAHIIAGVAKKGNTSYISVRNSNLVYTRTKTLTLYQCKLS